MLVKLARRDVNRTYAFFQIMLLPLTHQCTSTLHFIPSNFEVTTIVEKPASLSFFQVASQFFLATFRILLRNLTKHEASKQKKNFFLKITCSLTQLKLIFSEWSYSKIWKTLPVNDAYLITEKPTHNTQKTTSRMFSRTLFVTNQWQPEEYITKRVLGQPRNA